MPHRGKYRIQTVAEMTGVPAATLRAWERRYGIPTPERSSSSYRLFGDHDVAAIRRLKQLCDAGMSPAEAARLLAGVEEASNTAVEPDPYLRAGAAILAAIEDFDPPAVERAIRAAMFMGSASTVFQRVIGPTMRTVGERWHAGSFSIAQEHLASHALGSAARDMLRLLEPASAAPEAIVACFADEEHALPLYGVSFALVQWGYLPIVLGARTPPAAIRHAVERLAPALVALSVTVEPAPARARELVQGYAEAVAAVPWVVGGAGVEAMREQIERAGGIAVGTRALDEVKQIIDKRLRSMGSHRAHRV